MTSNKLDLDPIQALTLEAFSQALAQLESISALPVALREEINQVGEALTTHQTDVVDRLEDIAKKHQPLYDLYETAYEALDEQYHTQERNKLVANSSNGNLLETVEPIDKILQILRANSREQNKTDESVEDLIALVDEWMNEDSFYDQEVYPRIEAALKQHRVSI